jgi:hypothetical protein
MDGWMNIHACLFFLSSQTVIYDPIITSIRKMYDRRFTTSAKVIRRKISQFEINNHFDTGIYQ